MTIAPIEFENEFNLPAQVASEIILNWLFANKATIVPDQVQLPYKITAGHGDKWIPKVTNPNSRKKLEISIIPSDSIKNRIKIHISASVSISRNEREIKVIKEKWEAQLFSYLWAILKDEEGKEANIGVPRSSIIQYINHLAPNYEYQIPIERIEKQFGCNLCLIQQIIERFKYTGVDYVFLDKIIKVKPVPQVKVEKVEINGDSQSDIIDKVEIPLKFYLKNYGRFPANIYLHLNSVNLPTGIPYPPFTIKPGELQEKQIKISTKVQDNEYFIDILLCDSDNNNLEIPNSKIEVKINKKTSKKVKLKNVVKSIFVGTKDILTLF